MATSTLLGITLEVAITLVRFVIGFYAFWLVLRSLEGLVLKGGAVLRELDPLACELTDPFVQPVSRVTRLGPRSVCWIWLLLFAGFQVGLGRASGLV